MRCVVTRILLQGLSFCHDSLTCGNVTKPQVKGGAVKAMKTQPFIWAFLRCFLVSREYICRSMPPRAHAPPPAARSRFKVMERRGNGFSRPGRQSPPEGFTASHGGIRWGWSRMGGKPPIPRVLTGASPPRLRHAPPPLGGCGLPHRPRLGVEVYAGLARTQRLPDPRGARVVTRPAGDLGADSPRPLRQQPPAAAQTLDRAVYEPAQTLKS